MLLEKVAWQEKMEDPVSSTSKGWEMKRAVAVNKQEVALEAELAHGKASHALQAYIAAQTDAGANNTLTKLQNLKQRIVQAK